MRQVWILSLFCTLLFRFTPLHARDVNAPVDTNFVRQEIDRLLLSYSDSGKIDYVKYLLDHGANPNVKDEYGVTPLMYASQFGSFELVNLLLTNNADPNVAPYDGNTALVASVRAGNDSIAELLIKYNANVNVSNNLGLTPLHYSAWYGMPYMTDVLLYYGAKINSQDIYGNTPLILSVYSGAKISTKLLLDQGADPNQCNYSDVSPLMLAAQFNDTSLTKLLLDYNASINLLDKNKVNALAYAISNNSLDVIKLLCDYGASEQAIDKNYYQIGAESESKGVKVLLDSLGLKTKLKPSVGNVMLGTGVVFNNHEFLWGFNLGLTEQISKIQLSVGYLYRPYPIATLRYEDKGIFQYKEKRQIIELRVQRMFNIKTFSSGYRFGAYFGGNVDYVFRKFRGTNKDPKKTLYPGFNFGFYWGGEFAKLSLGWEFTGLRTPLASPHRLGVGLNIFFPTSSTRIVKTRINYVN